MDYNSRNPHLGVNRLSKPIRKPPLHQPPPAAAAPPPPQPQVYNISKNDFRSIVQQLTGTPTRDPANPNPNHPPPLPPPPARHPPSMRLQRIRPPPLTPIARPAPVPPLRPAWADSPVTAYMRYLETSLLSADSARRPGPGAGLLPPPDPAPILLPALVPLPLIRRCSPRLAPSSPSILFRHLARIISSSRPALIIRSRLPALIIRSRPLARSILCRHPAASSTCYHRGHRIHCYLRDSSTRHLSHLTSSRIFHPRLGSWGLGPGRSHRRRQDSTSRSLHPDFSPK